MEYEKHNFERGQTLTAAQMNEIEDCIAALCRLVGDGVALTIGSTATGDTASAEIRDGKLYLTLPRGEKGADGKDGATGKDGAKGDKGDKGDPGERGEKGDTPTLSIGTVEAGSAPSAIIIDDKLNLVLPEGVPGTPGEKGDPGEGLNEDEKAWLLTLLGTAASESDTLQAAWDKLAEAWGMKPIPVESVALNKNTLSLAVGKKETLTATVLPENATNKTITWSVSPEGFATVNGGVVSAIAEGECTITAAAGEKSASCAVTVTEAIEEVEDVPGETPVYKLEEAKTFVPENEEYIDTGIKMFENIDPKPEWTILFETKYGENVQKAANTYVLMHCMEEVSPWPGFCVQANVNGNLLVSMYTTKAMSLEYYEWLMIKKVKFAVRITDTELKRWNQRYDPVTAEITGYTSSVDKSLILGAYQESNGTKGRFWDGTLYQCLVYDKALTDEQIAAWIAG